MAIAQNGLFVKRAITLKAVIAESKFLSIVSHAEIDVQSIRRITNKGGIDMYVKALRFFSSSSTYSPL